MERDLAESLLEVSLQPNGGLMAFPPGQSDSVKQAISFSRTLRATVKELMTSTAWRLRVCLPLIFFSIPVHDSGAEPSTSVEQAQFVSLLSGYSKSLTALVSATMTGKISCSGQGSLEYTGSLDFGFDGDRIFLIKSALSGQGALVGSKTGVFLDGKHLMEIPYGEKRAVLRTKDLDIQSISGCFENPVALVDMMLRRSQSFTIFHFPNIGQLGHSGPATAAELPRMQKISTDKSILGETITVDFDTADYPTPDEKEREAIRVASLTLDKASGCPVKAVLLKCSSGDNEIWKDQWVATSLRAYRTKDGEFRFPESYTYSSGHKKSKGRLIKWETQSLDAISPLDKAAFTCDPRSFGANKILDTETGVETAIAPSRGDETK